MARGPHRGLVADIQHNERAVREETPDTLAGVLRLVALVDREAAFRRLAELYAELADWEDDPPALRSLAHDARENAVQLERELLDEAVDALANAPNDLERADVFAWIVSHLRWRADFARAAGLVDVYLAHDLPPDEAQPLELLRAWAVYLQNPSAAQDAILRVAEHSRARPWVRAQALYARACVCSFQNERRKAEESLRRVIALARAHPEDALVAAIARHATQAMQPPPH